MDRLVGIVEPNVHMHAENELLTRDEAQGADEVAVAGTGDDALVLPLSEGMRPRRPDRQPLAPRGIDDLTPERPQLRARHGDVRARVGRDLEHRLHELRLDLTAGRRLE